MVLPLDGYKPLFRPLPTVVLLVNDVPVLATNEELELAQEGTFKLKIGG